MCRPLGKLKKLIQPIVRIDCFSSSLISTRPRITRQKSEDDWFLSSTNPGWGQGSQKQIKMARKDFLKLKFFLVNHVSRGQQIVLLHASLNARYFSHRRKSTGIRNFSEQDHIHSIKVLLNRIIVELTDSQCDG